MNLNLHECAFARPGSHMALQHLPESWNLPGLILRTMRGSLGVRESFTVVLSRQGIEIPAAASASPWKLDLTALDGSAQAEFVMLAEDRMLFRVRGADLAFLSIPGQRQTGCELASGVFLVNAPLTSAHYQFRSQKGGMACHAIQHVRSSHRWDMVSDKEDNWVRVVFADGSHGVVDEYVSTPPEAGHCDFDAAAAGCRREWETLLAGGERDGVPCKASQRALYVLHSAMVRPTGAGCFRRPTVLMSRNWMTRCWSWDHCFNAVALAPTNPDLAWDQWMTVFDYQAKDGALPDSLSYGNVEWGYVKPPIHGWALARLMETPGVLTTARAAQAYEKLRAWTRWWLATRDTDGDGLPEYQHGNDSGFDNATVFDGGYPVASPELAGYLASQCMVVAALASRLGHAAEAARHRDAAQRLIARLAERLWDGAALRPRKAAGDFVRTGDSLLPFLVLSAGELLPDRIRHATVRGLARFVTPHGLASEAPHSALYNAHGYWRGPVWAPAVVLVCDGLRRSGYASLAARIAGDYTRTLAEHWTFPENLDALTGEPLCDPAYTWTASAFLLLQPMLAAEARADEAAAEPLAKVAHA